jgi:hypothetical protein
MTTRHETNDAYADAAARATVAQLQAADAAEARIDTILHETSAQGHARAAWSALAALALAWCLFGRG